MDRPDILVTLILAKPMLVIKYAPKRVATPNSEEMRAGLIMRLVAGKISEETFNRAMTMLEPNPLERLR